MIYNLFHPVLMKKSVKTLVLITHLLFFSGNINAQLRLPVASALAADVKKVIEDYPNRFINLMGEIIEEHPQSTDYQCNFKVNGAEESIITRYSANKEVCSWEALMLTTEDFDKAKQKFKSLYSQLNNLPAAIGNARNARFKASYTAPDEKKKSNSIEFEPEPAGEGTTRLRVELVLQFHAPMEWKVKLMVYDKEREDAERGKEKDE